MAFSFPILLCWFEIFALQKLQAFSKLEVTNVNVYVVANFFLQLNFILPLFLGMVMYDNDKERIKIN